jgi:hypothetical protein
LYQQRDTKQCLYQQLDTKQRGCQQWTYPHVHQTQATCT